MTVFAIQLVDSRLVIVVFPAGIVQALDSRKVMVRRSYFLGHSRWGDCIGRIIIVRLSFGSMGLSAQVVGRRVSLSVRIEAKTEA